MIVKSRERLDVLDGLRGIAVLLVLWYHVWEISWLPAPFPWLQFLPETGFVGVHLFFFLSGFVITYPFLYAHLFGGTAPSWRHFAWRRFVKIAPSYVLSIAVAFAIGYAQLQPSGPVWQSLLAHLLFIHTWFVPTYGSINGVLWTLAVEVEFYLCFPLIWWCFRRAPLLTAAVMILIAMFWRAAMMHCCYDTLFSFYEENLPGYLDIFACGMLCAYFYCRSQQTDTAPKLRLAGPLLAAVGVAALVLLLQGLYASRFEELWASVWQVWRREWFGFAFGAIALGALWSARGWQRILANPALIFLGAISYNLYLYHQMLARELLWHHIPPYAGDPHEDATWQTTYTLVAFTCTIVQAAIVTYVFERPLLRLPDPRLNWALFRSWGNADRR